MKPKVLNQNIIYGFGYDWGGAIVLRIMAHLGIFKKGIGFMPAYGQNGESENELRNIKETVMIQWVKKDQTHALDKFNPYLKQIKNLVIDHLSISQWKSECANNTYEKYSDELNIPVIKFLTGIDLNSNVMENQ